MARTKKIAVLMLAVILLAATVVGCSPKTEAPSGDEKQGETKETPAAGPKTLIQICGATSGGTYFLLSNAIAQLLNDNLDNVSASAQSTAGTPAILRLLEKGEAEFGFGQAGVADDAINGRGNFEGQKLTNIKAVTYMYPNVMQIAVRKDANIKSFADFKGKAFAVGATGSATEINSRDLAEVFGLDYLEKKDFKPEFTSESQSVDLLKNKQVAGANLIAALGSAAMMDLMSTGDYEVLPIGADVVAKLQEKSKAYFPVTIPANTYPNQPNDVETYAVANWIFTRADLSEEVVYDVVKTMYEKADTLAKAHKAAGSMKPENVINGQTVELHPGAEKYFKEIGAIK